MQIGLTNLVASSRRHDSKHQQPSSPHQSRRNNHQNLAPHLVLPISTRLPIPTRCISTPKLTPTSKNHANTRVTQHGVRANIHITALRGLPCPRGLVQGCQERLLLEASIARGQSRLRLCLLGCFHGRSWFTTCSLLFLAASITFSSTMVLASPRNDMPGSLSHLRNKQTLISFS
jgi:hypothetical protein